MSTEPPERFRQRAPGALSRFSQWTGSIIAAAVILLPMTAMAQTFPSTAEAAKFSSTALLVSLILIPLMILTNALFVAAEQSVELLRPAHIKAEVDPQRQGYLSRVYERRSDLMAGCIVGGETMQAWMIVVSLVPATYLAGFLRDQAPQLNWGAALVLSLLAVAVPVVALNITGGELIPKSLATLNPVRTAMRLKWFILTVPRAFAWQGLILAKVATLFTHRFGARATFARASLVEEEIKSIVSEAQQAGDMEESEKELLDSVFEFGDTIAREVMTPRTKLEAMPVDSMVSELVELIRSTGYSRIPIYEGTDDHIIGIIHAKDLLNLKDDPSRPTNLRTLTRPVVRVYETMDLHSLLKELRQSRAQFAVVQDEHGGTSGIVTIEDVIEELIGDIQDEYDREPEEIEKKETGFSVDGRMNLYDLNDEIGTQFASEEFDTVAGFVFGNFGRQPDVGESISIDGWTFRVDETDGPRLARLTIIPDAAVTHR